MRTRMLIPVAVAAVILGGVLLVPAAVAQLGAKSARPVTSSSAWHNRTSPTPSPTPRPSPSPVPPTLEAGPVSVKVSGFFSWALLDRDTGAIAGSKNIAATNSTESMIKAWIVSDYLRRQAASGKTPSSTRLAQASRAIRDSDDNAAQSLYVAGGGNAVVSRMISICKLTDTKIYSGWWSRTQISARDTVRMGNCVADGRAAGPRWTTWVLTEMTKVRGTTAAKDQHATTGGGRWGIIDGLPKQIVQQGVSIKNGWTLIGADGNWHVNCLAIGQNWVLAVLMRYPGSKGLQYGASVCKSVARQLVVPGSTVTPY
jgi:hypothetical protein